MQAKSRRPREGKSIEVLVELYVPFWVGIVKGYHQVQRVKPYALEAVFHKMSEEVSNSAHRERERGIRVDEIIFGHVQSK